MRKYLMTALAAVAFGAAFVSCTHSDDVYSPDPTPDPVNEQKAIELAKSEYAALFERTFGKVGKDVDWGFGSTSTRALTRTVTVNGDSYTKFPSTSEVNSNFPTRIPDDAKTDAELEELYKGKNNMWDLWAIYKDVVGKTEKNVKVIAPGEYSVGHSWANPANQVYNVYISVGSGNNLTLKRNGAEHVNFYILSGNITIDSNFGECGGIISVASGVTVNDQRNTIQHNDGIKIYNRGTYNATNTTKCDIGNYCTVYNEGKFKVTGALTYSPADANASFFMNSGDEAVLEASSMTLNSSGNFFNDGKVKIDGATTVTKSGIFWVNAGQYKTGSMTFSAGNSTFYNYCNLICTGHMELYTGQFNMMDNSYMEAGSANFGKDNFRVVMGNNSGVNVKGNVHFEKNRDGSEQGFFASGQKAYVRIAGKAQVEKHKYIFVLDGNITYGIQGGVEYLEAYDDYYKPYYEFRSNTTEVPADKFDQFNATPNTESCGATWTTGGGDPVQTVYRVICEDLEVGDEATDFDFNDVIFDVIPNTDASGKVTTTGATIKLICAGGIYELTVDGVEVHEKFDASLVGTENGKYPMINTGKGPNLPEVTFTTTKDCSTPAKINQNIKIIVKKPKYPTGIELTAVKAEAACKILVDDTYGKLSENVSVKTAYPNFVPYVNGTLARTDGKWWIND